MAKKKSAATRARSAITGRFISRVAAKRRPKTSVVERLTPRRRSRKRR